MLKVSEGTLMHGLVQKYSQSLLYVKLSFFMVQKPRLAKERMEAAMQKVVEKRHAQDDALYNSTV